MLLLCTGTGNDCSYAKAKDVARFATAAVWAVQLAVLLSVAQPLLAATNTLSFGYSDRNALLADGWDFIAKTSAGLPRNTEVTNGFGVSYDQVSHPGVIQIPAGPGDLWSSANDARNMLFRDLPAGWQSLRLQVRFAPTNQFQQAHLVIYGDDNNYLETGTAWNGDPALGNQRIYFIRETNGLPSPGYVNLAAPITNLSLRLDRDLTTGDVGAYYSADQTNWAYMGKDIQTLINPRLAIWAGGYGAGPPPYCDLKRLDIITSDSPTPTVLAAGPKRLVFSSAMGQTCTVTQTLSIARWGPVPLNWAVSNTIPWVSVDSTNGFDTGFCRVSVNTAGLPVGVYQAALNFVAPEATNSPLAVPVTLIVNPASRASVATWRDGHAGAMTVWVDDLVSNQTSAVEYDTLRTNGFTGTYVCNGTVAPGFLTNYYLNGMDIGSHLVDHTCQILDEPTFRQEIEPNIAGICATTPQPCDYLVSFAYPCGQTSARMQTVASDYFLMARGYNINLLEDATPGNLMWLKSFNSHEHFPYPPADLKTVVDAAIAQRKWFVMVLHAYTNDDGAVAYAAGKDVWGSSGASVLKYILQRDATVITNYTETAGCVQFDFYRLPMPVTGKRGFESSLRPQDQITLQLDVSGIATVYGLTLNGIPAAYTNKIINGRPTLLCNVTALTSVQTVALLVDSNNVAPILPLQADRGINPLDCLRVTNTASNAEAPIQSLAYALVNAPPGAQVDTNGVITWTPTLQQSFTTNVFTTVVTDNGVPALSATNSFTVFTSDHPTFFSILSINVSNDLARVTWFSVSNHLYRLQHSLGASDTNWISVSPDVLATGYSSTLSDGMDGTLQRVFRVLRVD